ncbi:SIT4 phosphatase-associated protein [Gracilaria domingensis]|nr:SIT4 phosphatase-associated protein [Gracilaria domingensis]
MTTSPDVVRSLSADELASTLPRSDRPPPPVDPIPPVIPMPEQQKVKSGLLKRIRRAFRLSAQHARNSRHDKHVRSHHPQPALYHDPTPVHPHSYSTSTSPPRAATQHVISPNHLANQSPHQSPHVPIKNEKHSRTFTWRGPLSSRNLQQERAGTALGDVGRSSRRHDPRKRASVNHNPSSSSDALLNQPNSNRPTRNSFRSLPGRVVSSPPSLTSRRFIVGPRKRMGTNAKLNASRPSAMSGPLGEGDSDSVKRLNRGFRVRPGLDGSMNLPSVASGMNVATSPLHGAVAFRTVVEGAVAGRLPFTSLLDAMFRLEEKLQTDVKEMLIKYLSKQENMEALIDRLTVVMPPTTDEDGIESPGGERERYRYSYVACMLLSNGPIQLRRSLFLNPKHLDRLVRVLGYGKPSDPVVVRYVCRVLHSVLRDSPEDTVRAMGRRKDFIDALLSHIAITGCPEVCLAMLSTVRCQAELKFGPSNKPVVGMMADSKLVDTLCEKLSAAAENGPLDGIASSTIENCSRVIVGIALRALVIPRYDISEEDTHANYMLKFNKDLSSLDVFSQPTPILRLLDSGLIALYSHDTRGYVLSTALTAVRYLLVTALNGQDSSLSTIRLQLMSVNTSAYEAGVRARIPELAKVLQCARKGAVVETMWEKVENPLGVVRLKILELLIVLLQHCSEVTAAAMIEAEIPRILIELFVRLKLNSLLHHFVSAIIEQAFMGRFAALRRCFLIDVRLLDHVMELWDVSVANSGNPAETPVNYIGELLRIACAVHDFFKHDSDEAFEMRAEIGEEKFTQFEQLCNGPVAEKLNENGPLCSPTDLPPRPGDTFGFDGYSGSLGGSHGSLFIKPRGPGTIVKS